MTRRLYAPFLVILMIAIVGLILPDLVHTTASYDAHQVSSQAKAQSVAPKGHNDREARPSPQKPGNGQEATSVYIITLKDNTTPAQFQAYRQQLIKQGAVIKYEYSIIKGFAVYIKPSQVQSIKKDPLVKNIEKDQEVHTL
ncbi:hypothetical protein PGT21_013691 [Puccinia graminis f. sp. tritici]|uniref:Inhibitor I9 domain-containing protein n=1 Tax=Puccinia graminis f. sp. tritici TaxID=56615 RepID=A0A5B0RJ09_PUCGR|nr:hypothetical protein PGT21_013691 [Puccinia graminis f. sp. tritici]KAA1124764.1 hypothetical protein PGTUg99_034027 [Puccinia graminis f. sp. tritici]